MTCSLLTIFSAGTALAGSDWGNGFKNEDECGIQLHALDAEDTEFSCIINNVPIGTHEFKIFQDPMNNDWNKSWGKDGTDKNIEVNVISEDYRTVEIHFIPLKNKYQIKVTATDVILVPPMEDIHPTATSATFDTNSIAIVSIIGAISLCSVAAFVVNIKRKTA